MVPMQFLGLAVVLIIGAVLLAACARSADSSELLAGDGPDGAAGSSEPAAAAAAPAIDENGIARATFGAGCFWCVEAVFERLEGVREVRSGYMGGKTENPTYQDICTGTTGHAEVCEIRFDPETIRFEDLLEVFWKTHDPTTLNRQGPDSGTQYRSAVFYHDAKQKELAETYKKKLDAAGAFDRPIVTEITAASKFYVAEKYHQDYFTNNPNQGYCAALIAPKVAKFEKVFGDKLKKKTKKDGVH